MFFAEITRDGIAFCAFETEREASEWIVDELGSDYSNDFWVGNNGKLHCSGRSLDFSAIVHNSLEHAITSNAAIDPEAMPTVFRALCDAVEIAQDAY
ncbi:hypothetical protein SAMN05216548_108189 [Faunimonas pinastri]|uniref:Uncharacterized protein n=1 Tax=Faunimonas pinastri TaxID=1855383 RepID=A0A1H9JN40_9HYPH|nr:hypothetical protein SAMN05216548_108189 [Faunimonas pinastri]